MTRPQVANEGKYFQIWRVTVTVFNAQSRRAYKGWSSSLGVGQGGNNSSPLKIMMRNVTQGFELADSCEHDNEPSASMKVGEFLDHMSNHQLLKKDLVSMKLLMFDYR
jgi:hypothetical protein